MIKQASTPDLAIEELGIAAIRLVAGHLGSRGRSSKERLGTPRLRRIMQYVDARLAGVVRLSDLAREIGLSEPYLARAFKAATGTTLHAALMDRRIARARSLMREAGRRRLSLAHIAADCGFASHAHMATAFQRVLGMSPSEWRRVAAQ